MKRLIPIILFLFAVAIALPQQYMPNRRKAFQPSGTTAFTPSSITGLKMWFRPEALAALGYAEGSSVSNWNDASGNNWYVTNATTGQWPYVTNTFNGIAINALYFDGGDGLWISNALALNVTRNIENCTIIGVARQTASGANKTILQIRTGTGTVYREHFYYNSGEQGSAAMITIDGTSSLAGVIDSASSVTAATCLHADYIHTNSTTVEGAIVNVYTNNVLGVTATGTAIPSNTTDTASLQIGVGTGRAIANAPFIGEIAEIIVYVPAISSAQRSQLYTDYFKSRYGLP